MELGKHTLMVLTEKLINLNTEIVNTADDVFNLLVPMIFQPLNEISMR